MAEFGLSLLARSRRSADVRHVLVDFGYSPEVLSNNIALLGIKADDIDAAVLSHGHLDHYGGFTGLFSGSERSEISQPTPGSICVGIAARSKLFSGIVPDVNA